MRFALDDRMEWESNPEAALSGSKWWREYKQKRMDSTWRRVPETERLCAAVWAYRRLVDLQQAYIEELLKERANE